MRGNMRKTLDRWKAGVELTKDEINLMTNFLFIEITQCWLELEKLRHPLANQLFERYSKEIGERINVKAMVVARNKRPLPEKSLKG